MRLLLVLALLGCRTRPFPDPSDLAAVDLAYVDLEPRADLTPLPDLVPRDLLLDCPALALDGISAHASAPALAALLPPSALTVEAWMYTPEIHAGIIAGVFGDKNADLWSLDVFQPPGGMGFQVSGVNIADGIGTTMPQPTGKWSHLAGVFDPVAKHVSVYLDGKQIVDYPTSVPQLIQGALPLSIGGGSFEGWLAELRISSVARYSSDFVPARAFAADADTIALYHLDERDGDVAHDDSGSHNDATLLHGAVFSSPPVCR